MHAWSGSKGCVLSGKRLSVWLVVVGLFSGGCVFAQNAGAASNPESPVLTTVAQIHALSLHQAAMSVPIRLHAILTYYEPSDGLVFAQDATGGIFVEPPSNAPPLQAGDLVTIVGTTVGDGFSANIRPSAIHFEKAGAFPQAVPATWRDLMRSTFDSDYVRLTGKVRDATVQLTTAQRDPQASAMGWDKDDWVNGHRRYILMDLQTDGGIVRVHMEHAAKVDPLALLDSQVTVEGVTGGIFDGKYQQIGAELWMSSAEHMHALGAAPGNPTALPLTRISRIMTGYYGSDNSQRVHVRGSVTLYQPGLQMTLETPDGEALLVNSYEQSPIQLGQVVDVVGFPDPHGYSEVLTEASVFPRRASRRFSPSPLPGTIRTSATIPTN